MTTVMSDVQPSLLLGAQLMAAAAHRLGHGECVWFTVGDSDTVYVACVGIGLGMEAAAASARDAMLSEITHSPEYRAPKHDNPTLEDLREAWSVTMREEVEHFDE